VSAHDVTLQPAPGAVNETENSLAPAPAPLTPLTTTTNAEPTQASPVASAPARPAPVKPASAASARQPASRPAASQPQSARPSYSPQTPSTSSASASANPPVTAAVEPVENTTVERRPSVPEVPQKQYQELVIPADSVVGLQI